MSERMRATVESRAASGLEMVEMDVPRVSTSPAVLQSMSSARPPV